MVMGKMEMEREGRWRMRRIWIEGLGAGGREREGGLTKTEVGTILMIFRPPRRPACQHPSTASTESTTKAQKGNIFSTVEIIIAPLVLADLASVARLHGTTSTTFTPPVSKTGGESYLGRIWGG
jgi:hypothetical protein